VRNLNKSNIYGMALVAIQIGDAIPRANHDQIFCMNDFTQKPVNLAHVRRPDKADKMFHAFKWPCAMNIDNAYYTLGKLRFRLEDRCELNEMCTVFFYPVFSYEFHIYHKMLLFVGDNNFTKFISLCNTIITANI